MATTKSCQNFGFPGFSSSPFKSFILASLMKSCGELKGLHPFVEFWLIKILRTCGFWISFGLMNQYGYFCFDKNTNSWQTIKVGATLATRVGTWLVFASAVSLTLPSHACTEWGWDLKLEGTLGRTQFHTGWYSLVWYDFLHFPSLLGLLVLSEKKICGKFQHLQFLFSFWFKSLKALLFLSPMPLGWTNYYISVHRCYHSTEGHAF